MDEYSELLIVNKPVVYISVSELLNTHQVCTQTLTLNQDHTGNTMSAAAFSLGVSVCAVVVGASGGFVSGPLGPSQTAAEGSWTSPHPAGSHRYYN